MMLLTKWEPFKDLTSLQGRINRLFDDSLIRSRFFDDDMLSGIWAPAVDLYETDNDIVIKAELPGVDKKDIKIKIEVKDNMLHLSGERKIEKDIKEENYHRKERYYGTFRRSFSLPAHVEHEKVKAKFKDGILEITLPKVEKAKPKKIEIGID